MRSWALALIGAVGLARLGQAQECKVLEVVPEFFGSTRENLLGECSKSGTCVNGTCVCEEGWTGKADFVDFEGADCQVNELALRVLWGVNIAATLILFARSAPRILLRWRQHVEARNAKLDQGLKFSIKNNRGLLACLAFTFVCFPSVLGAGILMVIDPQQRIGFDLGITILFALGKTGFYLAVWLFQPALLSSVLRGKRSTLYLVRINDTLSFLLCLFAGVLGYLPFLTYALSNGQDTLALVVYYMVMGGTTLQLVLLGAQAFYVKKKVIKVLNRSLSLTHSERTTKIKKALVAVQNENIKQVILQGTIYGAFTLWPFLMNKHAYFLPVGWLAYSILGKKLAFTTVSSGSGNTSSTGGASKSKGSSYNSKSKDDKSFSKDFPSSQAPSSFLATPENHYTKNFQDNVVSFHENLDDDNDYV